MTTYENELRALVARFPTLSAFLDYADPKREIFDLEHFPSEDEYAISTSTRTYPNIPWVQKDSGVWDSTGLVLSIDFHAVFGAESVLTKAMIAVIQSRRYRRAFRSSKGISRNFHVSAMRKQRRDVAVFQDALYRNTSAFDKVDRSGVDGYRLEENQYTQKYWPHEKAWMMRVARRGYSSGHSMPARHTRPYYNHHGPSLLNHYAQVHYERPPVPNILPGPPLPPIKPPHAPDLDRIYTVSRARLPPFLLTQADRLGKRPKDQFLCANAAARLCIASRALCRLPELRQKAAVYYGKKGFIAPKPHEHYGSYFSEVLEQVTKSHGSGFMTRAGLIPTFRLAAELYPLLETDLRWLKPTLYWLQRGARATTKAERSLAQRKVVSLFDRRTLKFYFDWSSSSAKVALDLANLRVPELVYQAGANETLSTIFNVGLFFTQLHGCSTWASVSALIISTLMRYDIPYDYVTAFLSELPLVYQSTFSSYITGAFTTAYSSYVSSEIGQHLAKVISTFSLVGVLASVGFAGTAEVWKQRISTLEPLLLSPRPSSVETLVVRCLGLVRVCYERISEAISRGDFALLWGGKKTLAEWTRTVACVEHDDLLDEPCRPAVKHQFDRKLAAGEFPASIRVQMSRKELIVFCESLIEEAVPLSAFYCENLVAMRGIEHAVSQLRGKIANLQRQGVDGAYRIPPLGFFLGGPPGIGKTSIISHIHEAVAMRMNWEMNQSGMHFVNLLNNFPIYNPSQWHAVCDDIDTVTAATGSPNHFSTTLDLINCKPLNIEAAAIEDKGRLWAGFGLVTYATNNMGGLLDKLTNNEGAFWRRLPYSVMLIPKPEYCGEGSNIIDSTKVPPNTYNLWTKIVVSSLDYSTLETNKVQASHYKPDREFTDISEFLIWFADKFEEYYLDKVRQAELRRDPNRCKKCGIPVKGHPNEVVCQSAVDVYQWTACFLLVAYFIPDFYNWYCIAYWAVYNHTVLKWDHFLLTTIPQKVLGQSYGSFLWQETCAAYRRTYLRKVSHQLKLGGGIAGIIGAMYLLHQYLTSLKFSNQGLTGSSHDVPQGIASRNNWNRVPVTPVRPFVNLSRATWSEADVLAVLAGSRIRMSYKGSSVWGLHLKQNVFVLPWHAFGSPNGSLTTFDGGSYATVEWGGHTFQVLIDERSVKQVPGRDAGLLYAPEANNLGRSAWKHLITVDMGSLQAPVVPDSMVFARPEPVYLSNGVSSTTKYGNRPADHAMWQYRLDTFGGECGTPLLVRCVNDSFFAGFHVAKFGSDGIGESLSQEALSPTFMLLMTSQAVEPVYQVQYHECDLHTSAPIFGPLPEKSSLWAQLSSPQPVGVVVGGTILNFRASRFKSSVVPMPEADLWEPLAIKYCGSYPVAFKPSPKGRMEDGHWIDPFTVNLSGAANISGDPDVWVQAVDDYCTGLSELPLLDRVRPLSLVDAFLGLQGTDIGGTALTTSVGPPHNAPKSRFMVFDHSTREVFIDPVIMEHYDRILAVVRSGDAYSPVCNYVLKDEAISLAKQEACKVRAFTVLPFAFNLLLKQYFGPVMNFCRAHPLFFETAIGMNSCGPDWTRLHDWLELFPLWGAADNSFFDVKESTHEALAVVDLMLRLCKAFNYTEEELRICKGLLFGCIYTTRVIKGDVFYASFMMSTGFWLTILINTFRNCLQRRYCFIRLRPDPNLVFREGIHQMTLGDDNVSTTVWEWYDQARIQAVCREFGAELTDAHKNPTISPFEDKTTVTFLKRRFVRSGQVSLAPIELKTLIRMATLRIRSSNVMECDQACAIYSNILAEAWMHGETVFDEFKNIIEHIVNIRGFQSISLKIRSYEDYVEAHAADTLTPWDLDPLF